MGEAQAESRTRSRLWAIAPWLVVAGSLLINTWDLDREGDSNPYYAEAIRSMAHSWHNLLFVAFDRGGFVSLDKPPVGFWLPALSVRVFGYHPWSMLGPNAVLAAATVGLIYLTVRAVWGRSVGLVAATVLAVTPLSVAVARNNTPDTALVFCLVLGAWAVTHAIGRADGRWMVVAGLAVGVGFEAKMLAALLVVPALWGAYLLAGRQSWRRRLLWTGLATGTLVATALAWMVFVDSVPAGSRPYVGGSANNSVADLAFGFNGLTRLSGSGGAASSTFKAFNTSPGPDRLTQPLLAEQISWLLPLAALGSVAALLLLARSRQRDDRLGSLLLWGGWAVATAGVFSLAKGLFHPYYLVLLAPAAAALTAIGIAALAGRLGSPRAMAAVGTVVVLAATAAQVVILRRYEWAPWLRWPVAVAGIAGAVLFGLAAFRARPSSARQVAAGVALAGLLLAPVAWCWNATRIAVNGPNPTVIVPLRQIPNWLLYAQFSSSPPGDLAAATNLLHYLEKQQRPARWIAGVPSALDAAAPLALYTGRPVLAFGGSHGVDPILTRGRLVALVATGQIRYFLLGGALGFGGRGADHVWPAGLIQQACRVVPAAEYGPWDPGHPLPGVAPTLYDCRGAAGRLDQVPDRAPIDPTVARARFLKLANQACSAASREIARAGPLPTAPAARDRWLVTRVIPAVRRELRALARLPQPPGDAAELAGLYRDTNRVLDALAREPSAITRPDGGGIDGIIQRFEGYGLASCGH